MGTVDERDTPRAQTALLEARLRAVREIAWAVGSSMDLDTLLHVVMEHVTRLVEAERSTLFIVERERAEIWSKVLQRGDDAPGEVSATEIRLPIGQGIAGWVAAHGTPLLLADPYADPRFDARWDRNSGFLTRALLSVPIHDRQNRTVAVIQCLNKPHGFNEDDLELLRAIGGPIAVALENARLYQALIQRNAELTDAQQRLRDANAELEMLYDLERSIARGHDEQSVVRIAIARIGHHLEAAGCAVLLGTGPAAGLFRWSAATSAITEQAVRLNVADAMLRGTPRHVRQAASELGTDGSLFGDEAVAEALLILPFAVGGEATGLLQLRDPGRARERPETQLRLAALLTSQLAHALERARSRRADETSERLSAVGTAVSSILHDLRTPIGATQGYLEMLEEAEDERERLGLTERVRDLLVYMEDLTGEVLRFARGGQDVLLSTVHLNTFIDEATTLVRPSLRRNGTTLVVKDHYRGPARFDRSKLLRVVANLARNASDATIRDGTLVWTIARDGDDLVMDFSDDGSGIPDARRGQLFELFASWGKADGTGLGLAMARRILVAHGGSIDCVHSGPDGTTFRLRLPIGHPTLDPG